ncbi:MAG: hypothetical protein KC414_09455, partial [Romboutsia sp.]|nr:hypothetical protein [Romboutsia sp.]
MIAKFDVFKNVHYKLKKKEFMSMKFTSASTFMITLLSVIRSTAPKIHQASKVLHPSKVSDYMNNNYPEFIKYRSELSDLLPEDIASKIGKELKDSNPISKDYPKTFKDESEEERTYEKDCIKFYILCLKKYFENKDKVTDDDQKKKYEEILKEFYEALEKKITDSSNLSKEQKDEFKKQLDEAYGKAVSDDKSKPDDDKSKSKDDKKPWYKNWKIILPII